MIREFKVDDRTTARTGYPDGHVEIDVDLPFPVNVVQGKATRSIPAHTVLNMIPMLRQAIQDAKLALGVDVRR